MTVPWHLGREPYAVQTEAIKRSFGKDDFAYFMEMGLGKTDTTLNDYVQCFLEDRVEILVVICPNSLKG